MTWQKIPGWLSIEEGSELQRLAKGRRVLEIGALYGRSTVCMASAAEHITSVDPHTGATVEHTEYRGASLERFKKNLKKHGVSHRVTYFVQTIETMLLSPGCFGLVFIDGDHSYEACSRDIAIAMQAVKDGGAIAVHDYEHPHYPGVKTAVDEWVGRYGFELGTVKSLAVVENVRHPVLGSVS